MFDLEVNWATRGTSENKQACSLQERTLLGGICLLVSALPGAIWVCSGEPLEPT